MIAKINLTVYNTPPNSLKHFSCVSEVFIPLTDLHRQMKASGDIVVGDSRHWHYSDRVFKEYVTVLAKLPINNIILFEDPFGFEKPSDISFNSFRKKAVQRIKMFYDIIKTTSPDKNVLSPGISVATAEIYEAYLDLFIECRNYFDTYSLHCCYDATEQSFAKLSGLLNEVIQILSKPVWITRWAIPSCDHLIVNNRFTQSSSWVRISQQDAAYRMQENFASIEKITKGNTRWFFSVFDRDLYGFDKHPDETSYFPDNERVWHGPTNGMWDYSHFLGISDFEQNPKAPIIDMLKKIRNNVKV